MPFTRAGFNPRSRGTGIFAWTRYVLDVEKRVFALAELRVHVAGDLFWRGVRPVFWEWGDQCVLGTLPVFELPEDWQHALPHSQLEPRRTDWCDREPGWLT